MMKSLVLAGVFLLLFPFLVYGAEVTVAWNANSDSDLAGYKIYYGNSSRNYSTTVDVGNVTSHRVTNLVADDPYYFAATAYDFSGNESAYSEEAVYDMPPAIPTNFRIAP